MCTVMIGVLYCRARSTSVVSLSVGQIGSLDVHEAEFASWVLRAAMEQLSLTSALSLEGRGDVWQRY
jgi:hypothetical protein